MQLKGSCHCGAVSFRLESSEPVPFMRCYCSICRKTAGGGGYAINLGARKGSLKVNGEQHASVYHAKMPDGSRSNAERHFCSQCGSALWLYDNRWPELIHPFASAIDSELPLPPERTHMMLDSKANWVEVDARGNDRCFADYPDESLAEWHQRVEWLDTHQSK